MTRMHSPWQSASSLCSTVQPCSAVRQTGDRMGWNYIYSIFPVFSNVPSVLQWSRRAGLLINGTIRLRVTQHFQVSLLDTDTELNIGLYAEADGPAPNVPKWKHAHAFVLWNGSVARWVKEPRAKSFRVASDYLAIIYWHDCLRNSHCIQRYACKIIKHIVILCVCVRRRVSELSPRRDQSVPESWLPN